MPRSTFLTTVYATDEDCYLEDPADFGVIIPTSNVYAYGTDGVITAGLLWTLASTSNDFVAQGIAPGMVVQLLEPKQAFQPRNRPQYLAVDIVSTNALGLRRCGEDAGTGRPPVAATGLSGITFQIMSLRPQIENAAYQLNEKYSIDPNLSYRNATSIYDQRIFRRLTALWVLYQLYASTNRTKDGDFAMKIDWFQKQYDDALSMATLRWGPAGQTQSSTTRFSTRIVR